MADDDSLRSRVLRWISKTPKPIRTVLVSIYVFFTYSSEGHRPGGREQHRFEQADFMEMTATAFERLVKQTWEEFGYSTRLTSGGADHGVDVIANSEDETLVIQAKRYGEANPVSAPTIRNVVGAAQQFQADRAVVVTSSWFTDPATETADQLDVELVDGEQLARWITDAGREYLENIS